MHFCCCQFLLLFTLLFVIQIVFSQNVQQIDFEANPELANIFELYDLLAVHGHKLFAHPTIVDDPEKALKSTGILDELSLNERMLNYARDFQEFIIVKGENAEGTERELIQEQRKRFLNIKYPNTKQLLFEPLLLDIINKVDIQNEIENDLKAIWEEESADELRLRQKYLFKFGFIVDCIFAYFMDDKHKINFHKIHTATITKINEVKQHPFYIILTENKCSSEDEIKIFVNLIISQNAQNNDIYGAELLYFYYIKKQFVNEMTNEAKMNGNMKEEYAQLRKDPYFPEKLPKIFNLLALLEVFPQIMTQLIWQIKPINYNNHQIYLMNQILLKTKIKILKGKKMFIASRYKRVVGQIPNKKLRTNLGAISVNDTIFTDIFKNDIKYQYEKWYYRLKLYMLKFLAEKYFGVCDLDDSDDWEKIVIKISENIMQKTLSHIAKENTRMEEEKKKNELLAQLHLRIFCLGILQMDSTKRILSKRNFIEKNIFHTNMDAELLEIVPGAMEKFNKIITPKEKLAQKNENQKMNLFFEAVSEVRREICEEKQRHKEEKKQLRRTIFSFINSESHL